MGQSTDGLIAYGVDPDTFSPQELADKTTQYRAAVVDFCRKYGIKLENDPAWLLFSNWS